MAELHIIGQVVGGSGFPSQDLYCKWSIVAGQNWSLLEGLVEGQTQVDVPKVSKRDEGKEREGKRRGK